MSVVSYSSSDTPFPCKCGTIPEVGMNFYYKSKYNNGMYIEGVIGKLSPPLNIVSTNGAYYKNDEIEIKPLHILRDEKLNELAI